MQSTQEINWWLEVVRIAIPSLITLIVGYLLFRKNEIYKNALSKELEDYKSNISKELEGHKIQLQTDFQTRLIQFQTKFSAFHQRRIEALEKLYELVAKVEIGIERWLVYDSISRLISKEQYFLELKSDQENLATFFDQKRIYFNDEIIKQVLNFVYFESGVVPRYDTVNFNVSNSPSIETIEAVKQLNAKGRKIEEAIIKLLYVEYPELKLEISTESIQKKLNTTL